MTIERCRRCDVHSDGTVRRCVVCQTEYPPTYDMLADQVASLRAERDELAAALVKLAITSSALDGVRSMHGTAWDAYEEAEKVCIELGRRLRAAGRGEGA